MLVYFTDENQLSLRSLWSVITRIIRKLVYSARTLLGGSVFQGRRRIHINFNARGDGLGVSTLGSSTLCPRAIDTTLEIFSFSSVRKSHFWNILPDGVGQIGPLRKTDNFSVSWNSWSDYLFLASLAILSRVKVKWLKPPFVSLCFVKLASETRLCLVCLDLYSLKNEMCGGCDIIIIPYLATALTYLLELNPESMEIIFNVSSCCGTQMWWSDWFIKWLDNIISE